MLFVMKFRQSLINKEQTFFFKYLTSLKKKNKIKNCNKVEIGDQTGQQTRIQGRKNKFN